MHVHIRRSLIFRIAMAFCFVTMIINCALLLVVKNNVIAGLNWVGITSDVLGVYAPPLRNRYTIDSISIPRASTIFHEKTDTVSKYFWLMQKYSSDLSGNDFSRARTLRNRVRNIVGDPDFRSAVTERNVLEIGVTLNANRTMTCYDYSVVFRDMLSHAGISARLIGFARNPPFSVFDTHTSVEAFVDGSWVLLDPTFNVDWFSTPTNSYHSAFSLSEAIRKSHFFDPLFSVQKADSASDAIGPGGDIRKYYISYLSLFDNILYIDDTEADIFKYPPFRMFSRKFTALVGSDRDVWRSPYVFNMFLSTLLYIALPLLSLAFLLLALLVKFQRVARDGSLEST
jgi:hypothetical protein